MKARHSAGFRLYHRPEHAKPSRHHNRAMRAASLFLAAACLPGHGGHQHVQPPK
mgnify:CR=1 FL=1